MSETARTENQAWRALEPYAQLVRSLLPSAASLHVFDDEGWLRWSTESITGPDLPRAVQSAQLEARNRRRIAGRRLEVDGESTPTYIWWLRDDAGGFVASVAVTTRAERENEAVSFEQAHAIVRPAIECLRSHLIGQSSLLQLHRSLTARDKDVELLLAVGDHTSDGPAHGVDGLSLLLHRAAALLGCSVAALAVPSRGVALGSTGDGTAADPPLVEIIERRLLDLVQMRREAVLLNTPCGAGEDLPYRVLCAPVRNSAGRVAGVLAMCREPHGAEFHVKDLRLVELLARRAWLNLEAAYDSLTGLLTRTVFERALLARAGGAGGAGGAAAKTDWTILYLDVDQMHATNERLGMHVGDAMLARIGELLRTHGPEGALSARLAGDRFVVAVPRTLFLAGEDAERIRLQVAKLDSGQSGSEAALTVTIGAAALGDGEDALSHALATSEGACKLGKQRGRNRVETHEDAGLAAIRGFADASTTADSRDALARQGRRLEALCMQPLAPPTAGLVPHYEVLLRMVGAQGETLGPERFMSAAQRLELMPAIDRWVFEQTVMMLRPHAALLAAAPIAFSINLSAHSLIDAAFHEFLIDGLHRSQLDPRALCFEIREADAVAHMARAEALARRLRRLGCGVALDDVGMSLSSLGQLRTLPITMLKFDGAVVRDVLRNPRTESMVQAITQLAHTMSIETVAEHVETEEIRQRLEALGVDYGQGFAVARPVPLQSVLDALPMHAQATTTWRAETVPTLSAAQAGGVRPGE
jgi:diguanylate cyclase (GGDEF)-like protein